MTTETRVSIEPKDIKAIEIECEKCHQRTVRRLDHWVQNIASCANCGANWTVYKSTLEALNEMAAVVQAFATGATGNSNVPFTIRFEIRE